MHEHLQQLDRCPSQYHKGCKCLHSSKLRQARNWLYKTQWHILRSSSLPNSFIEKHVLMTQATNNPDPFPQKMSKKIIWKDISPNVSKLAINKWNDVYVTDYQGAESPRPEVPFTTRWVSWSFKDGQQEGMEGTGALVLCRWEDELLSAAAEKQPRNLLKGL